MGKLLYATLGDGVLTNYPNEVRLTTGIKSLTWLIIMLCGEPQYL